MNTTKSQASPGRHGLSAADARAVTERVLNLSQAEQARVTIQAGRRSFTRSADNRITTAGGSTDVSVEIMSVFGKRVASVTTNRLDDDELPAAVRRSEELARLAPENPEYMGELAQQQYTSVSGYYDSTGGMAPDAFAAATAHTIREASGSGAVAAGYIDVRAGSQTLATSNGLFAHHPATGVASTLTVRMPDGSSSGWGGDEAADWNEIETERIAAAAVRKCLDWRNKTSLEPGRYTTILEPTAVGMLMLRMLNSFNARPADEGRSYYSRQGGGNRIGERLFDRRVTMVSDPVVRDAEAAPFSDEGLPRQRTMWVRDGMLQNLAYSRFWGDRQDVAPKPRPANLIMSGGNDSLAEMIASTRRGVLITRFWYIRGLNPRIISYTGLTRDGTFLIENGRISRPVTNFRFNQSLADMLQNIEMIGRPVRVAAGENSSVGMPIVVPALKVRDFHLASVSDAI
jgi:predicted Zn-dependent protease